MNRRDILKNLAYGALGSGLIYPFRNSISLGSNLGEKFLLRIHMGSWCGWSSGLLQPRDVDDYPLGVFQRNKQGVAFNPNMNKHYKTGNLVFHDYSKCLESIADHTCFTVGNSRSVSHPVARLFQNTGDRKIGSNANPSWAVGLSQADLGQRDASFVVQGTTNIKGVGGDEVVSTSKDTSNVVLVKAANIAQVASNFSDNNTLRDLQGKEKFTQIVQKNIQEADLGSTPIPNKTKVSMNSAIKSLAQGINNIEEFETGIKAAINKENIESIINTMADKEGVKERLTAYQGLLDNFQMAELLIEGKIASGMTMSLDNQDFHRGNAEVITARSAGCVWAMIANFWEWVKAKGLQDKVLICISHEFSRSPYNASRAPGAAIVTQNAQGVEEIINIENPGRDHHISFGMTFINGKVPPKGRVGGIADTYVPSGSDDLKGIANPDIAAYSSTQLVGSMMMRVWDDIFPDYRAVRDFWPNFKEKDIIPLLTE